jgi:hypothetical protein
LDGFGDVADPDVLLGGEVGGDAGDFQDAVVDAGAETLLLHGALEQGSASEESTQWQWARICWVFIWELEKMAREAERALPLVRAGCVGRPFLPGGTAKRACWRWRAERTRVRISAEPSADAPLRSSLLDRGNFDVDVDAVEQRATDLADLALDHGRAHMQSRDLSLK